MTLVASGEVVAAELSPSGATLVQPDGSGWLVHTNHFLAGPAAGTDTILAEQPGTLARREVLVRLLGDSVRAREALATHVPSAEPVCRHEDPPGTPWAERRATLLAIVIDAAAGEMRVAPGPPCTNGDARV